ncbi:hypothetical protein ACEPAF_6274 [Sanghuangporus sanghuang]
MPLNVGTFDPMGHEREDLLRDAVLILNPSRWNCGCNESTASQSEGEWKASAKSPTYPWCHHSADSTPSSYVKALNEMVLSADPDVSNFELGSALPTWHERDIEGMGVA